MRKANASTVDVSESECTDDPCPSDSETASFFLRATPDTSKVWFSSQAKLTDEDTSTTGRDLYLYSDGVDPEAEPDNLTLLSRNHEPADGGEARVQAVLGSSADGDTAYFVAERQLVAGATTAPGFKVYRWQDDDGTPALDYLFSLPAEAREAGINWFQSVGGDPDGGQSAAVSSSTAQSRRVSTDGRYLVIQSYAPLDPSLDYDGAIDTYRWDARDGLTCLSCQPPGSASNGNSWFAISKVGGGFFDEKAQPELSSISADGSKVFFQSRDPLLPSDENGDVLDVYEWNDGTLELISIGASPRRSYLLGVSENAGDVFFLTSERLVGWDLDANSDIYDARLGGGFPEPGPTTPLCEGQACRAGVAAPAPPVSPGTRAFEGPPDKPRLTSCGRGFRKVKVGGKRHCKKAHGHRRHHRHRNKQRPQGQKRGAGR